MSRTLQLAFEVVAVAATATTMDILVGRFIRWCKKRVWKRKADAMLAEREK